MFRPLLPVLLGALLISGCTRREELVNTPTLQVTKDTLLPAPMRDDLVAPNRETYLGPLDELNVEVFGVETLTREVTVDAGGLMSFPLVGTIDVNGKTAADLASLIRTSLQARYVRNPEVTVTVKNQASQFVTVDGEVERPGQFPVTNNSTLMRAVALGGGLSDFAKQSDVVILRTVGQQRMAGLYNIGQIRRGVYGDPPIYPNDVIIVGDSPARRLFRNVLQVAPLLTAPLVAVIQ